MLSKVKYGYAKEQSLPEAEVRVSSNNCAHRLGTAQRLQEKRP